MSERNLTARQRLFGYEYMIDLNATKAAIRAGYSKKTAYSQGNRLLRNVEIQKKIKKWGGQVENELNIKAIDIIKRLADIAFCNIGDFIEWDHKNQFKVKNIEDIPKGKFAALSSIACDENGGIRVKLRNPMRSLELLGKYFNVFNDGPTGSNIIPEIPEDEAEQMIKEALSGKVKRYFE